MASITVFDGANGIGGNKIYVGEGGKGVFLDFGKNFGKYGAYFEEFLKNRDNRGIHDLVQLGLIPKLDIYRNDLVPVDINPAQYKALDVSVVLLSHAHVDHSGNIGLLDMKIPVIASPLAIAILKGMQDSGISSVDSDAAYISPRIPGKSGLLLDSDKKASQQGRNFYCTSTPGPGLPGFMSRRPGQDGKNAKGYDAGECMSLDNAALPFKINPYEVDHSIFGSVGYILESDVAIAYTGDFRLHGKLGDKTRDFVHHAKDAAVLIIEGTRAGRNSGPGAETGEKAPSSEKSVYETCLGTAENAKGLIIADFSARNFERLETFLSIAEKTGRKLVITAKDVYLLHALECADGTCRYRSVGIYRELVDKTKRKWETEVVEAIAGGQYISHLDIRNNPGHYILCFSFFDMKHLLDIKPPTGGCYIYSSCEAFSEEMEIDFIRLGRWLDNFGIRPYGFGIAKGKKPGFDPGYHASGHASREDIAWVIDQVDPEIIIPVHTTGHEWFSQTFDGVRTVVEGEQVNL